MPDLPYKLLFQPVTDLDASEDPEWEWTSPHGREFRIVRSDSFDGPRYTAWEYKPSGSLYFEASKNHPHERFLHHGDLVEAVKETLNRVGPNEFYDSLPEGITPKNIISSGGGHSLGTITHDTWDNAVAAIEQAVIENRWLDHHSPELAQQRAKEMTESGQENRISLDYWKNQLSGLSAMTGPQLFRGLTNNLTQPISQDTQTALLAYLNNPSNETWERVYDRPLVAGKTPWQIWGDYDSASPQGMPPWRHDEVRIWPALPAPEDLKSYIRLTLQAEKEKAKAKIRENVKTLHDKGLDKELDAETIIDSITAENGQHLVMPEETAKEQPKVHALFKPEAD